MTGRMSAALLCGLLACSGAKDSDTGYYACFEAGTMVQTPRGPVAIESLRPGDVVWAWTEDGRRVPRGVVEHLVRDTVRIWTLDLGDRQIRVTDEHPFWSLTEDRWVPVRELVPGDALAELRGEKLAPITLRAMVRQREAVTVHNLSVEGPEHDYFAAGILVHNKTWPDPTPYTGSNGTFSVSVDWRDDGLEPVDTDGDGLVDSQCGDSVDIVIVDPLGFTEWSLGMAETGAEGWTGEDCFNGGGYAYCHGIGVNHTLNQVSTCDPADLVEGATTVFDASRDPGITYFVEDSAGACFVFGADPSYFEGLGCTEMM